MAWPVDARFQSFTANVTTITAAFTNAVQDAIYRIVGGSRTIKQLKVDGVGDVANATPGVNVTDGNGVIVVTGTQTTSLGVPSIPPLTSKDTALTFSSGSVSWESRVTSSGGLSLIRGQGAITTGDAVATNIFVLAIPTGRAVGLRTLTVGRKTDNTQMGVYEMIDGFVNNAGVVAAVAGAPGGAVTLEDDGTWGGVSWQINGTSVECRVSGKAATDINWMMSFEATFAG